MIHTFRAIQMRKNQEENLTIPLFFMLKFIIVLVKT